MLEIKDRIPTYPGRVRLTPVPGQENIYDMVRADEPIEPGTPINKALFSQIDVAMEALQKNVNNTLYAITSRTELFNLSIGTEIVLYEHGILTPFIVVARDSTNTKCTVLRKHIYKMDTLLAPGEYFYGNCKTDRWLNNEYITYLDAMTQAALISEDIVVTIPYAPEYISRKAFLLSTKQYDLTSSFNVNDGPASPYFTDARRVAEYNGTPSNHYTRTIHVDPGKDLCELITPSGSLSSAVSGSTTVAGIRPAFILPSTYEVTVGAPNTANTVAAAEVI